MWGREVNGLILTFHLAGINNQNFLMRDEETGTYWQQISGRAIAGPLAGRSLTLIPSDELTFALWKSEQPAGRVLQDVAPYAAEYSPKDWDVKMKKSPTVLSFPEHGFANRDIMIGVNAFGEARAFPYDLVIREQLVQDRVGSEPVILITGPDGKSVRAFREAGAAADTEFFRTPDGASPDNMMTDSIMMDSRTGSRWNFRGCAIEGKLKGVCLDRVEIVRDYWFDWRNYHPATSVYMGNGKALNKRK